MKNNGFLYHKSQELFILLVSFSISHHPSHVLFPSECPDCGAPPPYMPVSQFLSLLHSFTTLIGYICILISFQHPFTKIGGYTESAKLPSLLVPTASSWVESSQVTLRVGNSLEGLRTYWKLLYSNIWFITRKGYDQNLPKEESTTGRTQESVNREASVVPCLWRRVSSVCYKACETLLTREVYLSLEVQRFLLWLYGQLPIWQPQSATPLEVRLRIHDLKSYLKPHC